MLMTGFEQEVRKQQERLDDMDNWHDLPNIVKAEALSRLMETTISQRTDQEIRAALAFVLAGKEGE